MIKFTYCSLLMMCLGLTVFAQDHSPAKMITLEPGEKWYGGTVDDGSKMPFGENYAFNLYGNNKDNQAAPLLLSTKGRYVWSAQPFAFTFKNNQLLITHALGEILVEKPGTSLAQAFKGASHRNFPASGKMPDTLLFTKPQYNTWIELVYNQNQEDILKYAHHIIDNGFPPGVFMIDDNWADHYGKFSFRRDRFPDARKMVTELHALGFKVMIWVCPFVSPDTQVFRDLLAKKLLLMDAKGKGNVDWKTATEPALISWWNGYSASMDFTNPGAVKWFHEQLQLMCNTYGVDGFKFDAGDVEFYPETALTYKKATPNEQCELWGQFASFYPLNEYRAMWKRGGEPLAERLRDKKHSWEDLQKLIPNAVAAGLLGYQFTCPDMIGGGEYGSFIGLARLDQELLVRSAQCAALMPMMQFSVAPWRVLDSVHFNAVKKSVATRLKYTPYLLEVVRSAALSGEPIARSMEYEFPNQGYDSIKDQFMLGSQLMVAPMLARGLRREVVFPKGKWLAENGQTIKGPLRKDIDVPLNVLLVFKKIN